MYIYLYHTKKLTFCKRIIKRTECHTEMNISRNMKLGEQNETALMKIALADREQQRAIGVENGIMIK